MRKFNIFLFMLIFLVVTSSIARAQGLEGKIGYLDLSKIFDDYGKTKEYDKILEAATKDYEKARNEKIEKLRSAQDKLALLKDEEKTKLEADIEKQKNELLEFDRQKKTDLTKQRDEKIREILLEIEKIVREFAEKEGYALILNDRVLIYGKPTGDITDKVMKIMNEEYNKKATDTNANTKK